MLKNLKGARIAITGCRFLGRTVNGNSRYDVEFILDGSTEVTRTRPNAEFINRMGPPPTGEFVADFDSRGRIDDLRAL